MTFRVGAFLQTSGGGINLEKSWGCGKDGQVMGVYRQGGLKMVASGEKGRKESGREE